MKKHDQCVNAGQHHAGNIGTCFAIGEAKLTTDAGTGITQSFYLDEFQVAMLATACEQVGTMLDKRGESLEKFQQESRAA